MRSTKSSYDNFIKEQYHTPNCLFYYIMPFKLYQSIQINDISIKELV